MLTVTRRERPIENFCLSVWLPYSPGPALTPFRCAMRLTRVCGFQ